MNLLKNLFWVMVILIATAIIFAAFQPLTDIIREATHFDIFTRFSSTDGSSTSTVILAVNIFLTALVVPITEELYFRGFLLPRMPTQLGKGKPVAHSFLFSVYHFDTPWMIPVRTFGLLPLIYAHAAYASGVSSIHNSAYEDAIKALDVIDDNRGREIVQKTFDGVPRP